MAKHQHFISQSANLTKELESKIRSLVPQEKADRIIETCRQIPRGTIRITDTHIVLETEGITISHLIDVSNAVPKERSLEIEEVLGRSKEVLKRLKRTAGMPPSKSSDTT